MFDNKLKVCYAKLYDIKAEKNSELCQFGSKVVDTYKYRYLELQESFLKMMIEFYKVFNV